MVMVHGVLTSRAAFALGDTEEEALSEMKDAIQLHLEVMREREVPLPTPSTVSATTVDAA